MTIEIETYLSIARDDGSPDDVRQWAAWALVMLASQQATYKLVGSINKQPAP
jgi:hypothetical protein